MGSIWVHSELSSPHRLSLRYGLIGLIAFFVCNFASGDANAIEDSHEVEDGQPNVILIMVDDLGYNDLSGFGHPEIQTPILDQLARDGVRLTSFLFRCIRVHTLKDGVADRMLSRPNGVEEGSHRIQDGAT